ncbi:hypothetical protein [Modestobacter italicus]|uniref:hypothetical protein n=1 Tax=Modestobacter italicus (strain DSM 44449 / CECT 9708 / BC 501) TaxID=2732864 RepID=UPI001C96E2F9|nr:hypothetical protein [Modestobacter italicus]
MLPTSSSARTGLPHALTTTLTTALTAGVLLAAGVALAAPAAALEDPRRPTATVTHGPSCGPGVVRALVTNGSEPHRVALVFDGSTEQDAAVVGPGEQVELVSTDVAWGVTVAVSVAVTDQDGAVERPLELSTYTRPSAEDCAAVSAAPTSTTTSPAPSGPTEPPTSQPSTAPSAVPVPSTATSTPGGSAPPRSTPPPSSSSSPSSSSPDGSAAGRSGDDRPSGSAGSASAASVSPGGVVTVRATGFAPGEPVAVGIAGLDEPLTTVAAAADGSVQAVVQIPRGAALGTATVQFVGGESAATAGLDLQVAARSVPAAGQTGSPAVVAAGLALVGAAGTLGLVGARRTRGRHGTR